MLKYNYTQLPKDVNGKVKVVAYKGTTTFEDPWCTDDNEPLTIFANYCCVAHLEKMCAFLFRLIE